MAVQSNDTDLSDLLEKVGKGQAQLPDFQRSWVWDDNKICMLIQSITSGFPMGALMFLETGNDSVLFACKKFTGVSETLTVQPDYLVLDGQQRLTTLYQVFKCKNAVETCLAINKEKTIKRFYYLDIKEALNPKADRREAILSISDNKKITEDIGRHVKLDLSTPEKEFENMMFPLNIVFSSVDTNNWMLAFLNHYNKKDNAEYLQIFQDFQLKILTPILQYKIPVIKLTKDTSREAVCQIFENVNTGGVPLTVFELVTARFAIGGYKLRDKWSEIKSNFIAENNLLKVVDSTNFITSMTLLVSYKRNKNSNGTVSCKKKDVLRLELQDFIDHKDSLVKGFICAAHFLVQQGIYQIADLPYTSQLIPLAAIYAYAAEAKINLDIQNNKEMLCHWYWCGVFGEQYGGANETRYALDIVDVFNQITNGSQPDTVRSANFQAPRLLTMQTRNSAAYKGVMALILQDSPLDFMSANKMDIASYLKESTDIHHIFPQEYCKKKGYSDSKWDSVVNKTPIYASTNRSIGGRAPSEYIKTMANKGLTEEQMRRAISSHKIDFDLLSSDNFDGFITDRAIRLLDRIEVAMGKAVSGRDSEDTINTFGSKLIR